VLARTKKYISAPEAVFKNQFFGLKEGDPINLEYIRHLQLIPARKPGSEINFPTESPWKFMAVRIKKKLLSEER
jgi:hypothetical protein